MELIWWPVALVAALVLAACIGVAGFTRLRRATQLRRLAHADRLTTLPEYARLALLRSVAAIVSIALLILVFAAAAVVAARPGGLPAGAGDAQAAPREEIMLCVAEPATAPVTGRFLGYFARQATTLRSEGIGLTTPTRRVIPLTRDYQFAGSRLGEYAAVADDPAARTSRERAAAFAPDVRYTDYAATVEDVVAMCLTGFPPADPAAPQRRSLVYLGAAALRAPGDTRPSLFTTAQVADLATRAGVQVNAIALPSAGRSDALQKVVDDSGGRFVRYLPADDADGARLTAELDAVRAAAPTPAGPGAGTLSGTLRDAPELPLIVALALAGVLSFGLAVMRR
ncbi:hypothetical protein LV457_17125 [Mycobacterium sp. MYCO198283]|uniref:hypothetical protein n=1 Tax=Mycobacterium sp. MYCO198283 TaxID=2883505 RepID=UPI001E5FCB7C|nr:hypothetical protein [Mycobacterium sp. MYCO198283]MCG5433996.1 hypothetical protein [Mycobacterium sp. MYCO198283]